MNHGLESFLDCAEIPPIPSPAVPPLLAQMIRKNPWEGAVWEIYLTFRLHAQAASGCAEAGKTLASIRGSLATMAKERQPGFWGEWKIFQNQSLEMRQVFYPRWLVQEPRRLFLDPDSAAWVREAVMGYLIKYEPPAHPAPQDPDLDPEWADLSDPAEEAKILSDLRRKAESGEMLCLDEIRLAYNCIGDRSCLGGGPVVSEESGLRACCERYLKNEPLGSFAPARSEAIQNALGPAIRPPAQAGDGEGVVFRRLAEIRKKMESGNFLFEKETEPQLPFWIHCRNSLLGADASLNPYYFQFDTGLRTIPEPIHDGKGIHETDLTIMVAHAVARLDLDQFLGPTLQANRHTLRALAPWIVVEMVQAGRLHKAIELVTGKGAAQALDAGDRGAFERAYCLLGEIKKTATYCALFSYLCARLPELLPVEFQPDALKCLETIALSDPFWKNPDLRQGDAMVALTGAMLRCGEFGRARKLAEKLAKEFACRKSWNPDALLGQYLDAACYWYLDGNIPNLVQVLGDYLRLPSK